jgi:NadR type nicotinamide-nucleotide adenylyltransferase
MIDTKDIKRIAIIGPECTGKSDLSMYLADHFKTNWVPEYARVYLNDLERPYEQSDLKMIAEGQLYLEDQLAQSANRLIICDTNLYVIKVWSNFKYKNCDPEILKLITTRKYDLYLLTYVDIPWEEDPQREHPNQRAELYNIYLAEMKNQPVPFLEIKGDRSSRKKTAVEAIESLLRN